MRNPNFSSNRIRKDKTKKKKGKLEVREIRTETVLAFDVTDYVAFIVDFDGSDAGADYG